MSLYKAITPSTIQKDFGVNEPVKYVKGTIPEIEKWKNSPNFLDRAAGIIADSPFAAMRALAQGVGYVTDNAETFLNGRRKFKKQ